ncbi:MAG: response regulator, partial [Sphingomicrobium sp.]
MTAPQQILIVEDEPLIAMMLEDFLEVLDKRVAGSVDTVA